MLHRFLFALALLVLIPGALRADATGPQPTLPAIPLQCGTVTVTAEVAETPDQLQAGLMFRKHMADNDGMLFVLTNIGPAGFWMRNTVLPLSLAYLDVKGTILEIHDLKPRDETPVPSKSDKVAFALEMNQGWFDLNRIKPGQTFTLSTTTWAALDARRASRLKPKSSP